MKAMIEYIFNTLNNTEQTVRDINKSLKHQARFNRGVACLTLLGVMYATATEIHSLEQHKKIEKLSNEVEELKKELANRKE